MPSTQNKKPTPLWLRAIRDPEARAWLKKHRKEFPEESFLPDPVAFADKRQLAREKVASIIADGQPYEDSSQQRLSELVLKHAPREIARILKLPRREVYLRIRALKRAAISKWKAKRDKAVLERARETPLVTQEKIVPRLVQNRLFEWNGIQKVAYKIAWNRTERWVDEEGKPFAHEVQEILNDLEAHSENFETLEVADASN